MRLPTLPVLFALLPIVISGCATFAFPYRADVQQGNVVSQDMIARLRSGMSQREVIYLLGSPLLKDPFHSDRWDYYYSIKQGNTPREQRCLTLYFKNENLLRIEGAIGSNLQPLAGT